MSQDILMAFGMVALCSFGSPFLFIKVKREWSDKNKRDSNYILLFAAVLGIPLGLIFYYRLWFELFGHH
jgi:hypothetical protein